MAKNPFKAIGNALKPSNMMKGFLRVEPLKTLIQRLTFLSLGILGIFKGIGLSFYYGGQGVGYTFTGLSALIDYTGEYVATSSAKLWYEIHRQFYYLFLVLCS